MDDLCQNSINTCYESLFMTKNQPSLAHVINVTKNQPNLAHVANVAKNQPNLT
jgi:hypothetical protein